MSAVRSQDLDAQPSGAPDSQRPALRPPRGWDWWLLALMLAGGAAFLLAQTRGTVFLDDEWYWILFRRGSSLASFLDPHNSHLSLLPILIYKALFATVGLRHYWPYRIVVIAAHLSVVALVFVYARARAGSWPALLGAALILFFGPGWQEFLWPFQMAWLIALGAGIAALLALERGDRAGDVAACLLLAISLASAGPGLAVAAGLIVELALWRQLRRLWIVAIPLALYGLWWIGYQQTNVSHDSVYYTVRFVFDAAAGVFSSLAGLVNPDALTDTGDYLTWGPALLIAAVALFAWRLHGLAREAERGRRLRAAGPPSVGPVPGRLVTLVATLLAFWLITGIGRSLVSKGSLLFTSSGDESRYLYVGAVLVLLIAAEALRGIRITLGAQIVATVLVTAAVISNIGIVRSAAQAQRARSAVTMAELGALDITRGQVAPGFMPSDFIFGVVQAGPYFQAEDALGTPAASPAAIARAPDGVRAAADRQLIAIHRIALTPANSMTSSPAAAPPHVDASQGLAAAASGPCELVTAPAFTPAAGAPAVEVTVPPQGLLLEVRSVPATLQIRRFADAFEPLGTLEPDQPALLRIAADRAPQPWHIRVQPGGALRICSAG
ncbi:MAG TPA: hypothetical protein VKT31_13455 [Solirubrobacteraceae bacterium]|nr:hypothetical protein [Solirubrobacteraceae bacterium]